MKSESIHFRATLATLAYRNPRGANCVRTTRDMLLLVLSKAKPFSVTHNSPYNIIMQIYENNYIL